MKISKKGVIIYFTNVALMLLALFTVSFLRKDAIEINAISVSVILILALLVTVFVDMKADKSKEV